MKQIINGPSGNRLSICPLRFRIACPKISIDLGNSWGGDPESVGVIDLPITFEASHCLFNIEATCTSKTRPVTCFIRALSKLALYGCGFAAIFCIFQ